MPGLLRSGGTASLARPTWAGGADARISGRARKITGPGERARYTDTPPDAYPPFVLDVERVVRIRLEGTSPHLIVITWRPGLPLERVAAD